MTDTTLELRLQRLEAKSEADKTAILDAFRQLDELKDRVDRHYARIRALEGDPIQQRDTIRRAIREPMEQPAPEAAPDHELIMTWDRHMRSDIGDRLRAVYDLGHEHGAAAAHCPHIRTSDEGTSYCALAEQTATAKPTSNDRQIRSSGPVAACPPPAGGLVEVVENAIVIERAKWLGVGDHEARAAIRAVAWWLRAQGDPYASAWATILEQEANQAPRQAPVPRSLVMP
jgi:hypothetical protein